MNLPPPTPSPESPSPASPPRAESPFSTSPPLAEPLCAWIDAQYHHSALQMLRSISATDIVKQRPGFGQSVRAARGSVVASPVLGAYDPEPDYFFHWFRDSAIVMDALRLLYAEGTLGNEALQLFAEFVQFSLDLHHLNGRRLVTQPQWRERVQPGFTQYLRTPADLEAAHGEAIDGETRVNADGTLDISSWPRPQYDGIATRALTLQRWLRLTSLTPAVRATAARLLQSDLSYTRAHWREPCFDIWEEERGLHYYTLCVAAAALEGEADAELIHQRLDDYWLPAAGFYRSRILPRGEPSAKELDISVILAAIHADSARATHSPSDPRMHATLEQLEQLFAQRYLINRQRPPGRGPAMGRYDGDVYYSGGAFYFSTLGAAEYCYRAAAGAHTGGFIRRGDAFLETVRAFTPASGDLSEQFDQNTGAQSSARDLAWSYAAFISCIAARRLALSNTPAA